MILNENVVIFNQLEPYSLSHVQLLLGEKVLQTLVVGEDLACHSIHYAIFSRQTLQALVLNHALDNSFRAVLIVLRRRQLPSHVASTCILDPDVKCLYKW